MIKRQDLLALDFYKREKFTGSFCGMRYRVETCIEKPDLKLKATVWPEPYAFDATEDDKKTAEEFDYSEDGMCKVAQWLNEQYEQHDWRM